jgi:hypothetical protein
MLISAKRTQFVAGVTEACLMRCDLAEARVAAPRIERRPTKVVSPNESVDEAIGELDASKVLQKQRLNCLL